MEQFASQDLGSYSLYFDLKSCFRDRNVTGTFMKRAPARVIDTHWTVIRKNKTTANFWWGCAYQFPKSSRYFRQTCFWGIKNMIFCSSIQEATLSIMLRILHVSTFWKIFFNEVNYSQLKKSGRKLSFDFAGKQHPSLR